MLPLEHPDRIEIAFDDHRLINNAGLCCPPPWPSAWVCGNSLTTTWTWEMRQGGPTLATS